MSMGLRIAVFTVSWTLAACGGGDSSRSAGAAGKAPPNPPFDGSASTGTATGSDTTTTTDTDTSSSTGTGTETLDNLCEEKDPDLEVQNQINFEPDCKNLRFTSPGNFNFFMRQSSNEHVIAFWWYDKDDKAPDPNKKYTVADITSATNPEILGGYYKQHPGIKIPPPELPTAFTLQFKVPPKSEDSPYEATFEFDQPDLEFPDLSRNFKGTVEGHQP